MSQRQQIINEIKSILDTSPRVYSYFIQDLNNPDLWHTKEGEVLTEAECLKVQARGHFFIQRASNHIK